MRECGALCTITGAYLIFSFCSPTLPPYASPQEANPYRGVATAPASPGEANESLQRVKLAGFEVVISELETELDYLRRATRYLEE